MNNLFNKLMFPSRFILLLSMLLLVMPGVMLSSANLHAREPSLVVLVAVDQLLPDRLTADLPGGLGRLMREGYIYTNTTLDHGITSTCPGHVAMATGVNPSTAGISGNSYIDPTDWRERYCVDNDKAAQAVLGGSGNRSPEAMRASTLGDWLKQASPRSRVFSVAAKDRAAITLGGHQADGAYWFDRSQNRFTSSRYYVDTLPAYVQSFNGTDFFVDGFGGGIPETWAHAPGTTRPDDFPGESQSRSRVSGHPLNTGELAERAGNIYFSPWIDSATLTLAKRILVEEKLGKGETTDMLAVSFSATDTVGHLYGPYSAESEDTLARLDAGLGDLLEFLDAELGSEAYLLALSSDHGVLPLPEWLQMNNQQTCPVTPGRLDMATFGFWTYWHIYWKHTLPWGKPSRLVDFSPGQATVNRQYAQELGITVDAVVASMEAYFEAQPGIAEAWTQAEILNGKSAMARLYRHSLVPGKSGDLLIEIEEGCLLWFEEGTTHGSPHRYDRQVPLVFFGKGIAPGQSDAPVHTIDLAPTLAQLLQLKVPTNLEGKALAFSSEESYKESSERSYKESSKETSEKAFGDTTDDGAL